MKNTTSIFKSYTSLKIKQLILSSFAVLALTTAIQAQTGIGLEAGLNLSTIKVPNTNIATPYHTKAGMKIGATVDIHIHGGLSLQPGLFYSMMGGKANVYDAGSGEYFEDVTKLNYAQVPLDLMYYLKIGRGKLLFGAGATFRYALGGVITSTGMPDWKIKYGSDASDDFRQGDAGINLTAGYELAGGIFMRIGYDHGFSNICPASVGITNTNSAFCISVGWQHVRKTHHAAEGASEKGSTKFR